MPKCMCTQTVWGVGGSTLYLFTALFNSGPPLGCMSSRSQRRISLKFAIKWSEMSETLLGANWHKKLTLQRKKNTTCLWYVIHVFFFFFFFFPFASQRVFQLINLYSVQTCSLSLAPCRRRERVPSGESWVMADAAAGGGFKAQCKFLLSSCWSSVWTSSYTLWCITSVWRETRRRGRKFFYEWHASGGVQDVGKPDKPGKVWGLTLTHHRTQKSVRT